jgi:hypothetical protein
MALGNGGTVKQRWHVLQAGEGDGSCYVRPMTDAELDQQSRSVQAVS